LRGNDKTDVEMHYLRLARCNGCVHEERRRQESVLPVLRQAGLAELFGAWGKMTVRKRITIDSEQQLARILELVDGDPVLLPGAHRVYRKDLHEIMVRVPGEVLCDTLRAALMRARANVSGGQVSGIGAGDNNG